MEFVRNNQHRIREADATQYMMAGVVKYRTKPGNCVECVRTTVKPVAYERKPGSKQLNTKKRTLAYCEYRTKCTASWVCTHAKCAGVYGNPTYLHPQCIAAHEIHCMPSVTGSLRLAMNTVVESPVKPH